MKILLMTMKAQFSSLNWCLESISDNHVGFTGKTEYLQKAFAILKQWLEAEWDNTGHLQRPYRTMSRQTGCLMLALDPVLPELWGFSSCLKSLLCKVGAFKPVAMTWGHWAASAVIAGHWALLRNKQLKMHQLMPSFRTPWQLREVWTLSYSENHSLIAKCQLTEC